MYKIINNQIVRKKRVNTHALGRDFIIGANIISQRQLKINKTA